MARFPNSRKFSARQLFHMTVIASTLIDGDGAPAPDIPSGRSGLKQQKERREQDEGIVESSNRARRGMAVAIVLGAMIAPEASAGEFCRRDVTGHMTGCGYDSMDQCQAASSGLGGDCFRDPSLGDSEKAGDSRNSYAYHPKSSRSRNGSPAAGKAGNTNQ